MATIITDHFSLEKTQPYFVYFVKLNGLSIGDTWQSYEYMAWINDRHRAFQNTAGIQWKNVVAASGLTDYQ